MFIVNSYFNSSAQRKFFLYKFKYNKHCRHNYIHLNLKVFECEWRMKQENRKDIAAQGREVAETVNSLIKSYKFKEMLKA